jgi:hypothetical protein
VINRSPEIYLELTVDILEVNKENEPKDLSMLEPIVAQPFEYDHTKMTTMLSNSESSCIMRRMLQTIELEESWQKLIFNCLVLNFLVPQ